MAASPEEINDIRRAERAALGITETEKGASESALSGSVPDRKAHSGSYEHEGTPWKSQGPFAAYGGIFHPGAASHLTELFCFW